MGPALPARSSARPFTRLTDGASRGWLRTRESNPARTAYETVVMRQLNLPAIIWLPQMESNHLPVGYQPTARPESLAAMDPSGRLELPCQPYQSCGSPSILAGNNYGAGSENRTPVCRIRICRSTN